MTGKQLFIGAAIVAIAIVVLSRVWRSTPESLEPPPPFSLTDHHLRLAPGSKFSARLQIEQLSKAAGENMALRSVGQIIALSNTSGNLTGNPVSWVELDPKLSRSVGLRFVEIPAVQPGVAFGLTALAEEYFGRLHDGDPIAISRYGLRKSSIPGSIYRVIPREQGDRVDIVFRFAQAQDWFPGTNCEVVFPHLAGRPVRIPTTAPIHIGAREYVWKVTGPGEFAAQSVSVVDSTPDDLSVLGLSPGDRIVTRGAILLKPLLEPLLAQPKEKS